MHVLLTGAAGIVGQQLRPHLAARYESVLLTDLRDPGPLAANESFEPGDIEDTEFLDRIVGQVDAIVHLAGLVGPEFTLDQVMGANVNGTRRLFEAAVRHGVRQVVYASSHHAVGMLPRGAAIDAATPPRADSPYGVSKAFGEILAAYFADKHALNVLSIRIGYVGHTIPDERRTHTWCSARDLAALVELGLSRQDLGYRIVYGVSETPDPFFDNRAATELGYRPRDRAGDHLADPALAEAAPDLDQLDSRFVGGHFAALDFHGEVERLLDEHLP